MVIGHSHGFDLPYARTREMIASGAYGRLRMMGSGFQLAHGGGRLDTAAPAVGAHTDAVLAEAGYGPEKIAALRAAEIV